MDRLVSDGLWSEVARLAARATGRRAAVAYVTHEHVEFGEGDTLICDASDAAVAAGQTDATLLARWVGRGVRVLSHPGLHAKVLLLGGGAADALAVIGSANLSASSAVHLVEAAIISDAPSAVATTAAFLDHLGRRSERVDQAFLRRISAIEVRRPARAGGVRRHHIGTFEQSPPRAWLIGVDEQDDDAHPEERATAERGQKLAEQLNGGCRGEVYRYRWTKSGRFGKGARPGDTVIEIFRPDGPRTVVYHHAIVVRRQVERACVYLYVEHAADADRRAIPLRRFRRLAERVGLKFAASNWPERTISEYQCNALQRQWPVR